MKTLLQEAGFGCGLEGDPWGLMILVLRLAVQSRGQLGADEGGSHMPRRERGRGSRSASTLALRGPAI